MSRFQSRDDMKNKVYIGNLPKNADEKEIERAFERYGTIKNVWVARNPPGFGFVEFLDPRDATDAIRGLDGSSVCGSRVRVEPATGGSKNKSRGGDVRRRDYGRRESPRRGYSPRRSDSHRRGYSPKRRDSPSRDDSLRRRDSPRRDDSLRRRDSPRRDDSMKRNDSPRDRSLSPRENRRTPESPRRGGSYRRDRSNSRRGVKRTPSSNRSRSRSRSPVQSPKRRRSRS